MEDGDIAAAGPAAGAEISLMDALREVLKTALIHDGLTRGLRECAKDLDCKKAHLCVLAENLSQPAISTLIEALCAEHGINLIKVKNSKMLGEWAGLCKIDAEGEARKIVACSCVVVTDYGAESDALTVLLEHFNKA